jgi:iron complex outermembrane recepter protein
LKIFWLPKTLVLICTLFCSLTQPRFANGVPQTASASQTRAAVLNNQSSIHTADSLAQNAQPEVNITGVKLIPTDNGLEVVLEKKGDSVRSPLIKTEGNQWIAEIDNVTLALPEGESFQKINPASGITEVTVRQIDPGKVQVTVTGESEIPVAVVKFEEAIAAQPSDPESEEEGEEELVVTGQQETGYRAPSATTATKTDTPLRDIPGTINVVPRKLLEDRQITRLEQIADNVPGVQQSPYALAPTGLGGAENFKKDRSIRR